MLPGEFYRNMNSDDQRGKFITIYAGGAAPAQRIVDAMDPALWRLRSQGVRPGPTPTARLSRHREAEIRVGQSGVIWTYWADNYKQDERVRRG